MDFAFWLSFVLVCLVGLPIQAAIVHYDWYGGDQQKRSLGNRIVSMGAISNLLSSISALIFPIFVRSEKERINFLLTSKCMSKMANEI